MPKRYCVHYDDAITSTTNQCSNRTDSEDNRRRKEQSMAHNEPSELMCFSISPPHTIHQVKMIALRPSFHCIVCTMSSFSVVCRSLFHLCFFFVFFSWLVASFAALIQQNAVFVCRKIRFLSGVYILIDNRKLSDQMQNIDFSCG